ncbi:cytosolic glycoprotein FP21 [Aphelenchoides avenae]|nr:cytosolic glycoprotein FP21 [Aphelenchus avenae]
MTGSLSEPVIEKDAVTQEVKWLDLTPYEQQFLNIPAPALLEIVTAANYLDIPSHYHSACQAIAALIKGKRPGEVRLILRQRNDLVWNDTKEIVHLSPWLDTYYEREANIEEPIHIPAEVLVTILEKLSRADIERFQLVSSQFLDVILDNQNPLRKLSEERGPLTPVDVELGSTLHSYQDVVPVDGLGDFCQSVVGLAQRLKFCRVSKMR